MLRHVVLFKVKPEHQASIPKLIHELKALKGKIDGLLEMEAGADIVNSRRSYDFALIATFPDRAALDHYQDHPLHVAVAQQITEVRESVIACDFLL